MTHRLNIPELGAFIILAEPWTFALQPESRNSALLESAGWQWYGGREEQEVRYARLRKAGWIATEIEEQFGCHEKYDWSKEVTLPAGTQLKFDRIYIRKGSAEYSSVTFFLDRKTVDPAYSDVCLNLHSKKGKARFWAKLGDINKIIYR